MAVSLFSPSAVLDPPPLAGGDFDIGRVKVTMFTRLFSTLPKFLGRIKVGWVWRCFTVPSQLASITRFLFFFLAAMQSKVSFILTPQSIESKFILMYTNCYWQIVLLLAGWAVVASCMPTDQVIPDQDAEGQFLYSYGYGYPGFAYPSVPLAATYPAGEFLMQSALMIDRVINLFNTQLFVRIKFRLQRLSWSPSRPSPMPIPAITLTQGILIPAVLVTLTGTPSQPKRNDTQQHHLSIIWFYFFKFPSPSQHDVKATALT